MCPLIQHLYYSLALQYDLISLNISQRSFTILLSTHLQTGYVYNDLKRLPSVIMTKKKGVGYGLYFTPRAITAQNSFRLYYMCVASLRSRLAALSNYLKQIEEQSQSRAAGSPHKSTRAVLSYTMPKINVYYFHRFS